VAHVSRPVSSAVRPWSSSVSHTARQQGQRPVVRSRLYRIVVNGSSSIAGQAGQRPSASRPSYTLAHEVAVAHSVTSATSAGGSVTLLSVSPRDSASVVARLRYVRRDGAVDTEDRWLSVVPKDGGLLIYDSERIGAA